MRLLRSAAARYLDHDLCMVERIEREPPFQARTDLVKALTASIIPNGCCQPLSYMQRVGFRLLCDKSRSVVDVRHDTAPMRVTALFDHPPERVVSNVELQWR